MQQNIKLCVYPKGREGMAAYALEMDIYDKLNRIYYHAKKVARDMANKIPEKHPSANKR